MGKTLADLQSNISISAENAVTGTLLWVDDYTGFSGDPAEQSGNYIALKISAESLGEALEGATITATYHGRTVTLDSDQIIIVRQAEGEDTITFTANKEGYTEGRLTLDFSGLTLTPEPAKFSLVCNTPAITFTPNGTMAGGVATFEITATGQVPYDTTTSSNLINMTLTTNASPNYDQTDDSILVAYVDSEETTHALYTGSLTWSDDVGTATFNCPISADSITYSPVIAIVVDGTNATRVSQVLDTSALTLEAEPQTLTISIPENNELVAQSVNDSTKQAPTSYFFAPSGDQKITTITNVSSDGRTMSIGADSGNTDGSRRLYSMYTLKPLNGEGNTTMNGAIIPIKITRLDSTNTVKFRKGNSDHTNRNVSFNNDNVGYILTGPSWNNDWPYYIDVYNSSNELIDTYTINCLGYAYSYDWSISPISDFSSNGAYSQLVRSTLAADSDIVPNIEDASGNPVSVATFHQNLVIPSSGFNGQFASGTVHYVQGLKYSDTQTPLADGYYMIMKIPAYSGAQGNQISKMRSNQFGNSTGRQDYTIPTTDKILMPIPWSTDVNSGTLTTEIFPYFYNSMEIVSYRNLYYQSNLTIDPVPTPSPYTITGNYLTIDGNDTITDSYGDTKSISDVITTAVIDSSTAGTSADPWTVNLTLAGYTPTGQSSTNYLFGIKFTTTTPSGTNVISRNANNKPTMTDSNMKVLGWDNSYLWPPAYIVWQSKTAGSNPSGTTSTITIDYASTSTASTSKKYIRFTFS